MTKPKDKQPCLPGLAPVLITGAKEKREAEKMRVSDCPHCSSKGSVAWNEDEKCCRCAMCGKVNAKRSQKIREM